MAGEDPILDYASQGLSTDRIHSNAPIARMLCGFAIGGILGLLLSHLLARYIGPLSFCCVPGQLCIGCVVGLCVAASRLRPGHAARWRGLAALSLILLLFFQVWTIAWSDTRLRAEMEHGMRLPPSARNFQCRGDALTTISDRAAITWFEISAADLNPFLAQLKTSPNVPPFGAELANSEYGGHQKTWVGTPTFNQMLRCSSPVGDFLIVEVWDLPAGGHLIKMYTDWN